MGQLVDEVKPQFDDRINFIVVFIEKPEEQPVAEKYNVQYTPTTVLFDKDGKQVESFTGVVDKGVLTQKLQDLAK